MEYETKNAKFKIALLGDSTVGKTSIIKRLINNDFKENQLSTIGTEQNTKTIKLNENSEEEILCTLQIFDTAGQEKFRSITPNYIKNADGIVLVFDLTNSSSFENIKYWIKQIHNNKKYENLPFIIVGNKYDLKDEIVVQEDKIKFNGKNSENFFYCSAKDNYNVYEIFETISKKMVEQDNILNSSIENKTKINQNSICLVKKKRKCCI